MPNDSEIALVRMQEQLKQLIEAGQEAKVSRKEQYGRIEEIARDVHDLRGRMEQVEKQFASTAPTIAEFIQVKHKIQGAGTAGKFVWAIAAFIIGLLVSSREMIRDWLMR